jgi:uncharacterized membrane protein YeaQ/YmgE (transglycosylase-associated protein family)
MGFIVSLVVGALAGIVAQRVTKVNAPFGLIGDIVLGIVGGGIGGFLVGLLGLSSGGTLVGSFVVAVIGAAVLLWVVRRIRS